jgi:hypothetical protein
MTKLYNIQMAAKKIHLIENSVIPLQWNGSHFIMVDQLLAELQCVLCRSKGLPNGAVGDFLSQYFLY